METPISKLFLFIIYFDRACKECGQECCADFTFNFVFDVELHKILKNEDLKIADLIKSVCYDKSECPENKNHLNYTKRLFVTLPEYLIINTGITYEKDNCFFKFSNFLKFSIDKNNLYISNQKFSKKNLNTVYTLDSFILKTKILYKNYKDNQWYYEEGNNKGIIEDFEKSDFSNEFPVLFIYKKTIKK